MIMKTKSTLVVTLKKRPAVTAHVQKASARECPPRQRVRSFDTL
jgi:hypothetical protein